MNHSFISENKCRRLIAIFLGWAMDSHAVENLSVDGYDILAIWDYNILEVDLTPFRNYDEIIVMAWSFGVPAASYFIASNPSLPITARIAVNGTLYPVDDDLGIPPAIFRGTLDNISQESLLKFYRRMAGSGDKFRRFSLNLPERDIKSLSNELRAISARDCFVTSWDTAFISQMDRIIPPSNQAAAWHRNASRIIELPGGHLPDFRQLADSIITDKELVGRRFSRAMSSYDDNADVQKIIAARLVEYWNPSSAESPDLLEIGCGTGLSTREILQRITPRTLLLWDMNISPSLPSAAFKKECDAELEINNLAPGSLDIIFSASTVQWFNSLPAFLRNAARALRQGGKMVLSTFGPDNFSALYSITGTSPRFPSVDEIRNMLPESLSMDLSVTESIAMPFSDTATMLRHLSLTGVNALARNASPAVTRAVLRDYPRDAHGGVTLHYNPIYLILRKL